MHARKVEENGSDSTIAAQAVEKFPSIFRQTNRRANQEKAQRWWTTRNYFLSAIETVRGINHCPLVAVLNENAQFVENK